MSQKQWIAGINAVSAALEHDAEHVREVLIEAGAKNPRLTEIESNARRLDIDVDDAELERRRAEWSPPHVPLTDRGYLRLYVEHVTGADEGADFDFLRGGSGSDVPRRAF